MSREEGQRERERILSRFHAQHGAQCGAQSYNPGIMIRAEIKSQTLKHLSHLATPNNKII